MNIFYRILTVTILSATTYEGYCQISGNSYEILNLQYHEQKMHDTTYMQNVAFLVDKSIKEPELKKRLDLYKKIAWSKKQYQTYRVTYYSLLANHATFTHKSGEAIFYLQKLEEELKKITPYINSLNLHRHLLVIYGTNEKGNYEKRKEVFTEALPLLKALPTLILEKDVPAKTCINALTILNNASRLYMNLNDSVMISTIRKVGGEIWNSLQNKNSILNTQKQQCLYLYYQILYTTSLMYQKLDSAKKILDESYAIIHDNTNTKHIWIRSAERALIRKYIDFFINLNQPDSSRYYIKLLEQKINKNDPGDGTPQLLYTAKVNAIDNNFKLAYQNLLSAYETNDSIINLRTADINNNMYALLISEQKHIENLELQKQKQKRNIIIALLSVITLLFVYIFVMLMRRKDKKAREKVEELKKLTNIEIAELEIKANLIQSKLGMELHDDIAGQLVFLCNYIDNKIIEETNINFQNKLQTLADLTRNTYITTRNKSHEWYAEGKKEEQKSFSKSISNLVEYALPNEQYEKTIEIDEESLNKISHSTQIELIRIVQEAFVNILKHSKATKVQLYVYEEDNKIITQINDNGKGFEIKRNQNGQNIGLKSLRNKLKSMNGMLDIQSSKNGTELLVIIPI